MTVEGATDAEVFRTYVKQVLGPTLARRQVQLLFLPPYSPDVSPMELCVSKLKTALRAAKARTREALETAIRKALETVTAADAGNWFKHCGYAL
jgi:transposase